MMYSDDMTGAGWLWLIGGGVALVVVTIAGAWLVARSTQSGRLPGSTPLDILREGFARGEISTDEFEKTRQALH